MIYTICDRCGKKMEGAPMTPFNIFAANNDNEPKIPRYLITTYAENGKAKGINLCPDCENEMDRFLYEELMELKDEKEN